MDTPPQNILAWERVKLLRPYFDVVRLVDAEHTLVHEEGYGESCEMQGCFSIWGKPTRCNNCISLEAMRNHSRCNKLEYSREGLFFVISQYVPYGKDGAVIEMVTRLKDEYVDNVFDKSLLYINLDAINHQLDHDDLTGAFNRRYIDAHLGDYVAGAHSQHKNLGIAMLDIDGFKQLNDSYGHLAGDTVLKTVAGILKENISRDAGDFAARFGGDEFVVVCRDISTEDFIRRIEAVSKIIEHVSVDGETRLSVGISAGCVSVSEFPEYTATQLIDKADKRLYIAKSSGRKRIVSHD